MGRSGTEMASRSVGEGINYDPNLGYAYLPVLRESGVILNKGLVTMIYDDAACFAVEQLIALNRIGQARDKVFFIMEIRPGQPMRAVGKAYRSRRGTIITRELVEF